MADRAIYIGEPMDMSEDYALKMVKTDESKIWTVTKPCKKVVVEVYDDGNVVLLVDDGERTFVATIVEKENE